MDAKDIEATLNRHLRDNGVVLRFGTGARHDFHKYPKETQRQIAALLIARAKTGPLLKPDGLGEPLHGELSGFAKIKLKALSIRILYRPMHINGAITMEVIAIGPRERNEVYKRAVARLRET